MQTLRHRITLQSPAGIRDAVGERVTTWANVATVFANITPVTAREQFALAQVQSAATHKVKLRYSTIVAAINTSWRVLFGIRIFTIDSVTNFEERNIELELLCTEGARVE